MGSSSSSYSTSSFSPLLYHHCCCNYNPQAFDGLLLLPLQCASNDFSPLEPPAELLIIKSTPPIGSERGKDTSDHRQQQTTAEKQDSSRQQMNKQQSSREDNYL